MLYLVATPIGNLKEITYRAKEVFESVEYIACEDTRTSRVLLNHLGINKPLKSYHKFNETKSSLEIIEDIRKGIDVALISDAGMPGISDPGSIIVNALKKENLPYTVVSGASAFVNAFVLSGYETPVTFVGFLPDNNSKTSTLLDNLSKVESTLIFYASPHSLTEDLSRLYEGLGDREICVVREISKKFEEITFSTLASGYDGIVKGEFVVVVNKPKLKESTLGDIDKDLEILLNMGLTKTEASKVIAKARNLKKGDIYKELISK